MSAYRFVTLTCDGCGEIFDERDMRKFSEARAFAKTYGWTHKGNEDKCGVCNGTRYRGQFMDYPIGELTTPTESKETQ